MRGGKQGEPAPAGANFKQMVVLAKPELFTDTLELVGLGILKRVFRAVEHG